MNKKIKRKKIREIIHVPEGINVEITETKIKLRKGNDSVERALIYDVSNKDNNLIVECEKPTKKDKRLIKTMSAHLKNMIRGLENKFEYKLQICSVHFPMNVEIKGKEVVIKNFLGEKVERKAKILEGVEVKIEGETITVSGSDREKTGQTAANIEKATRIKKRDRRIFQDGIWMTEKPGRIIPEEENSDKDEKTEEKISRDSEQSEENKEKAKEEKEEEK